MNAAAIRSLKSWVARFDPTAPISTREAQKLAASLTYSFRKQFDIKYPLIDKRSKRSIEMHVGTILSGPHFNDSSVCRIPNAARLNHDSQAECMNQLRQSADPPMIYFTKCVSAGVATQRLAAACLRTEYTISHGLSLVDVREHAKSSGAGTTVLNWLNCSSHGVGLSSLKNPHLRKLLIFFIMAEEKEHLVWEWLQKLKNTTVARPRSPSDQIVLSRFQCSIIKDILSFEWRCGHESHSMVENFSQKVQEISLLAGDSVIDHLIRWLIKILRSWGGFKLSVIELLSRIIGEWDTDPPYRCALVNLYRPQHASGSLPSSRGPDLAPALTLLRHYPMENIFTDSDRRREDLMLLSFRLVDLLSRDGSDAAMKSATWVMGFLHAHFVAEIHLLERREREQDNLKLLDTLLEV